jgi:hypothetical protein
MDSRPPLSERWIVHPAHPWIPPCIAALLLLSAMSAAALDGALGGFFDEGQWRGLAIAPSVILYIVVIAPIVSRADRQVPYSLRPLLLLSDDEFTRWTNKRSYIRSDVELAAFAAGAAGGMLLVVLTTSTPIVFSWRFIYWSATTATMFALLAWTIYVSIAGTRLTAALHRQPMQINLFDTAAFEAVGRQSLLLALVFVGGITLSLLFQATQPDSLRTIQFWLVYLPLAIVPVAVFFLNMLPTHRVLAAAKRREITLAHRHMLQAYRAMQIRLDAGQNDPGQIAEANLLLTYEQRLRETRTWPYNTAMLRTLFLSVLVPIATILIQMIIKRLFP